MTGRLGGGGGGITPKDWDTGCDIFLGYFSRKKILGMFHKFLINFWVPGF